jgi:hypothetical protein
MPRPAPSTTVLSRVGLRSQAADKERTRHARGGRGTERSPHILFSPRGEGAGMQIQGGHTARPCRNCHPDGKRAEHAKRYRHGRSRTGVVEKTGIGGPLIRPTGTFSPLGRRGNRDVATYPFAPSTVVGKTGRDRWLDRGKVAAVGCGVQPFISPRRPAPRHPSAQNHPDAGQRDLTLPGSGRR